MEESLKHFGILGMHWGERRFQNPDGSLTPEGRERYGVGPVQNPKNVGKWMSDDELRQMTDRYRKETNFYRSRNEYLEAEQRYNQLTHPPKKTSRFLENVFIMPIEKALGKNVEASLLLLGASFMEKSKYADMYTTYIFGGGGKKNKNQQQNKQYRGYPSTPWKHERDDDDDDDDD